MNKMTFIGWIGLTALACQSNTEGYQIKGNIEGAGNGIAIMTLPVGREEPTTGDTVKMKNGVFTFNGAITLRGLPFQVIALHLVSNGVVP